MTKKEAEFLAKHWNENFAGNTEETRTKAVVVKSSIGKKYDVEIVPDGERNNGRSFHHVEELSIISKAFKANTYIMIWNDTVIGRIF